VVVCCGVVFQQADSQPTQPAQPASIWVMMRCLLLVFLPRRRVFVFQNCLGAAHAVFPERHDPISSSFAVVRAGGEALSPKTGRRKLRVCLAGVCVCQYGPFSPLPRSPVFSFIIIIIIINPTKSGVIVAMVVTHVLSCSEKTCVCPKVHMSRGRELGGRARQGRGKSVLFAAVLGGPWQMAFGGPVAVRMSPMLFPWIG
jgi:hypothetical protein